MTREERLKEIEACRKMMLRIYSGGFNTDRDLRKLLCKDIPWLLAQLHQLRKEK